MRFLSLKLGCACVKLGLGLNASSPKDVASCHSPKRQRQGFRCFGSSVRGAVGVTRASCSKCPCPVLGFLGASPKMVFFPFGVLQNNQTRNTLKKDTHFPDPKGFWLQAAAVPALQASSGSAEAKPGARKGSAWRRVLKLGRTCCKFTTSHIGACQSELPFGRVRFTRESLGSNTEENQEETGNPTKASRIRLQDPYVRPVHVGNHGTNHKQQTRSHKRKPNLFEVTWVSSAFFRDPLRSLPAGGRQVSGHAAHRFWPPLRAFQQRQRTAAGAAVLRHERVGRLHPAV